MRAGFNKSTRLPSELFPTARHRMFLWRGITVFLHSSGLHLLSGGLTGIMFAVIWLRRECQDKEQFSPRMIASDFTPQIKGDSPR